MASRFVATVSAAAVWMLALGTRSMFEAADRFAIGTRSPRFERAICRHLTTSVVEWEPKNPSTYAQAT